tara:strand:+ start:1033 stop:1506 length:474 start_codon:yes stop_codon:yes gene_type:complete
MSICLSIDPGPVRSGWVLYDSEKESVLVGAIEANHQVLWRVASSTAHVLVCERFEARGMPLGDSSITTIYWTGRFHQAWDGPAYFIRRRDVKLHLCGTARAKDSNINAALWDRFSKGQGMRVAKGTKKKPGPLYGITSHMLAALAVVITWQDTRALQ